MDIQEFLDSFRDLDPENVGSWPLSIRIIIFILVFIAVLYAGYHIQISKQLIELEKFQAEEITLKKDYEEKSFKAANLIAYRKQMEEMEISFGALLRQLPGDTEVPGLLEDISHTGLGSGLEFKSISLGTEKKAEFYSELPINIIVVGGFHSFANFVSGVAALPRIVTLHDFKITRNKESTGELSVSVVAKTYRYNEEAEE